ncbi:MAG: hypothetical protein ACKO2P_19020, partial [Planctomycetota bacterium]
MAAAPESLSVRQMLSVANPVVVDLHRHYFNHWLEGDPAYKDFRGFIGPKHDLMRETLELLQARTPDFSVAGSDVPEFAAFSEHIGFSKYTLDEKGSQRPYFEYIGELDRVFSEYAEGTAGIEITPEGDSDEAVNKLGHMGMPFIDLSSAEAIKALKGRKEFDYEILKEEAFRNEVRILNHPTKEEATDAVYKHLEQKDKNDRD